MFKFDFSTSSEEFPNDPEKQINWIPANEIKPDLKLANTFVESLEDKDILNFRSHDSNIKYISTSFATNRLSFYDDENIIVTSEHNHSDLLPGKYEGGLKIWEGTQDLANFLNIEYPSIFEKKKVLDLGCGAGILGILTCLKGANVVFQDYNSSVLKLCTLVNVILNGLWNSTNFPCKFYSGDWQSFSDLPENSKQFDIILTSETIYNVDNFSKLHAVFENTLADNGLVFLAAKSCYFGVGGGTRQFEQFLREKNIFCSEVVWKFTGGVNREILKIFRK